MNQLGSRAVTAVVVAATNGNINGWMYQWKDGLMDESLESRAVVAVVVAATK